LKIIKYQIPVIYRAWSGRAELLLGLVGSGSKNQARAGL